MSEAIYVRSYVRTNVTARSGGSSWKDTLEEMEMWQRKICKFFILLYVFSDDEFLKSNYLFDKYNLKT